MTKSPRRISTFCARAHLLSSSLEMRLAVLEPVDAAEAGDVEEHAAAGHLALGMLDAEHVEAARVDQLGVMAVIGLVLVEDVAERVPMGGALNAQIERVVGVADLVPVLLAGDGVGAGGEHLVDRVEAPAEQAGLRAVAVERDAEREHLAGADQARGVHDVLRRDVIERADLVVLAPPSPVRQLLRGFGDRLSANLDVHRPSSFQFVDPHARVARVLLRAHGTGQHDFGAPEAVRPRKGSIAPDFVKRTHRPCRRAGIHPGSSPGQAFAGTCARFYRAPAK